MPDYIFLMQTNFGMVVILTMMMILLEMTYSVLIVCHLQDVKSLEL